MKKYETSEAAIRREIETALRDKHKREEDKRRHELEALPAQVRVKSFLLPDKQPLMVRLGNAFSSFFERGVKTLTERPDASQKFSSLLAKANQKAADDQTRLLIVERLIDSMSREEQRLQSHARETRRAAELFKKRAGRKAKVKAKDLKAADATAALADAAHKELIAFEKIKGPRLVILERLQKDFESLVHDKHAANHADLLKVESALSVAMAEKTIEVSHVVVDAIKNRREHAKQLVVVEESQSFSQKVVLNEDIFIPLEKQVEAFEELARQSQQAVDNLPPVDLEILSHEQLLELSKAVDEGLALMHDACLEAKSMEDAMAASVKRYSEMAIVWHERRAQALDASNDVLAAQALSRVEQYENARERSKPVLIEVQATAQKIIDRAARMERARELIAARLGALTSQTE